MKLAAKSIDLKPQMQAGLQSCFSADREARILSYATSFLCDPLASLDTLACRPWFKPVRSRTTTRTNDDKHVREQQAQKRSESRRMIIATEQMSSDPCG